MRKKHGQHNLELCIELLNKGNYKDWVVTTAFYSSVHFVEHALFPLIERGIEYIDFDAYYQASNQKITKHSVKCNLVRQYITTVSASYRALLDECNNSRYIDYNVTSNNAIEAKKKAEAIKAACLTIKP